MKRARNLAILAIVALVGLVTYLVVTSSEHKNENTFTPLPQQNELRNLIVTAGYGIDGIPAYDAKLNRWTINVSVPGCKATVELGGTPGPLLQVPKSFEVVSIGNTPPPAGVRGVWGLAPSELTSAPGIWKQLGCS